MFNKEDPDLTFLQKTKVKVSSLLSKKISFGFHNGVAVDCDGKSGGLSMFWKEEINFKVVQYSKNHIHGKVVLGDSDDHFWVIGVYDHPEASQRLEIWSMLKLLNTHEVRSWFTLGDFNKILDVSEKWWVEFDPSLKRGPLGTICPIVA